MPRIITSWLPRRAPYQLKSAGATPCSMRYLPAGLSFLIEPAGEMWSVVMLSPSTASTRRADDVGERRRLHRDALEERRIADVGRVRLPT
ncbi:MAG: hypothetical protein QM736_01245 [Vicinamibacterales bacterium]